MSEEFGARVLRAGEGDVSPPAGCRDRFMIDGGETDQRFALVQHLFEPHAIAAPVHRHHLEDEYTFVQTGRIGALLGDTELVAEPGDLIFKPRGQWHTFWNAGAEPASCLEVISPAGLEQFFRLLAERGDEIEPDELGALAAPYRCDADMARTGPLMERRGLRW